MILSAHQPVYLPGVILFNKIALSDAFMFAGHCQYTQKSWQTRNRIRHNDSERWLSVPVKKSGRFGQSIDETQFANLGKWKSTHLEQIRQEYCKRPYFQAYFKPITALINADWPNLGSLNRGLIRHFLKILEIGTPILDSKDYFIRGHKTDLLIAASMAAGADQHLSNEGSRAYVDEQQMAAAGIQHCWQVFEHPVYDQGHPFISNLSLIDLLFNVGPAASEIVRSSGHIEPGKFSPGEGKLKC